jgi:hypothetical protein
VIAALGHLAVWAGLYVAAAVVCCAQLMGVPLGWRVLVFAWCTAVFAYLLDRVKARQAWVDPADLVAHPARYEFLWRRAGWVRLLMAAIGVISAALGWAISPVLATATVLAAAGVMVYAGMPRGRIGHLRESAGPPLSSGARVKDVFVLKNLFVGMGIAGFAVVVVAAAAAGDGVRGLVEWSVERWALVALAASHLVVRVFADAVLCDIDDEASDREHATQTLPTRMGGELAWLIAMWLRLGLAASLLAWPVGPWRIRVAWALVTAVSTVALRWWRPRRVRDVVDARFAAEAAFVWGMMAFG